MPDWLTHVFSAWAVWNLLSLKFGMRYRGVFIAGSLLPDVKNMSMITPIDVEPVLSVFHTPAGALVFSGILSHMFFRNSVKQSCIFLMLGISSLFHFLLDILVFSMDGRVMLFFPFSFEAYSFNIFMQEDFAFLYTGFLALLVSFIVLWLQSRVQRGKKAPDKRRGDELPLCNR